MVLVRLFSDLSISEVWRMRIVTLSFVFIGDVGWNFLIVTNLHVLLRGCSNDEGIKISTCLIVIYFRDITPIDLVSIKSESSVRGESDLNVQILLRF